MRSRAALLVISVLTLTIAAAPRPDRGTHGSENGGVTRPTTTPTTQPLIAELLGTYRGTVVDEDETVPCLTIFREHNGTVVGKYTVRVGTKEAYDGKLDDFTIVNPSNRVCRFRWRDKHGQGYASIQLAPDGQSFAGSWGLDVVQEKLVWNGKREPARGTRGSQE